MREGGSRRGIDRWRLLARLLPFEVRERIFEPALGDLIREHLTGRNGATPRLLFGIRATATFLGCAGIALPRLVVRRGRLTRLAQAVLWMALAGAALVVFLARVSGDYSG